MITGDAAGGGGVITTGATPVRVPGTLAGPAASALSICGPSVLTGPSECGDADGCVEADGWYGSDVVAQPAATPATASTPTRESFQLISTSKAGVPVHAQCHFFSNEPLWTT